MGPIMVSTPSLRRFQTHPNHSKEIIMIVLIIEIQKLKHVLFVHPLITSHATVRGIINRVSLRVPCVAKLIKNCFFMRRSPVAFTAEMIRQVADLSTGLRHHLLAFITREATLTTIPRGSTTSMGQKTNILVRDEY